MNSSDDVDCIHAPETEVEWEAEGGLVYSCEREDLSVDDVNGGGSGGRTSCRI